jgi:hypothetical protein
MIASLGTGTSRTSHARPLLQEVAVLPNTVHGRYGSIGPAGGFQKQILRFRSATSGTVLQLQVAHRVSTVKHPELGTVDSGASQ